MPSFADSIFLFVLALLLFGPKKLPVLARELGKWIGEFRRASNEFKMQMEEELRLSEQADRQKQIAAMEAAAPLPPPLEEPSHPHLASSSAPEAAIPPAPSASDEAGSTFASTATETAPFIEPSPVASSPAEPAADITDGVRPIPIATSGDLHMMPPTTGLPAPRSRNVNPLGGLLDSIPETESPEHAFAGDASTETAAHGD